jgi:SH3 domain protein
MAFGLFIILTLTLINALSASEKLYVTDVQRITLRTGPSIKNKIIASLFSGQVLEVLEKQADWSRVRVLEDGAGQKEGWALNHYLIDRMPYKLQVSSLMEENNRIKENFSRTKQQLEELVSREKMLSQKLQESEATSRKLQKDFEILKQDSSGYLKLKAEYDGVQSKLKKLTQQHEMLVAENKELKAYDRNKWFITGVLVLLGGLLLGLMFGRQQRRRSSSYY